MTVSADGSGGFAADPVASACFRLGWRIEELFSHYPVPEGPPPAYDLARLPGLSKLTSYDWQRLGLEQADFVLSQVTARIGSPEVTALNLTADARAKLELAITDGAGAQSRRDSYREALYGLHVNLLITLTAANSSYGKAYGLGRALADTTRPDQSAEQLAASFELHRIRQLHAWLDELTSLLPDHAAQAVAQSLTWWQQAVAAALTGQAALPSAERLAAALSHQGALWRRVVDGDKMCIDLLTPADYLRAGERLARRYTELVGRTLRTIPWLLAVLLLLLAGVVLALILIPGSAVARTATGVAAAAGTLSAIWKLIHTRVTPIAAQLERPLWGTELNAAVAEAVTIPPVGTQQAPAHPPPPVAS